MSVYNENCPSRKVLEIISNKWVILIIDLLSEKTYRYLELKREIEGISQKILTQTLRRLEVCGFVQRREYQTLPLKVEYSLTQLGRSLSKIFARITVWSEKNIDAINQAQKGFDTP